MRIAMPLSKGSYIRKCYEIDCQNYMGVLIEGDPNICGFTRAELKVFNKMGLDFCKKINKNSKCNCNLLHNITFYMYMNNITYKDVKGDNSPKFNQIRNYVLTKLLKEI